MLKRTPASPKAAKPWELDAFTRLVIMAGKKTSSGRTPSVLLRDMNPPVHLSMTGGYTCSREADPHDAVFESALPGTKVGIPSNSIGVYLFSN